MKNKLPYIPGTSVLATLFVQSLSAQTPYTDYLGAGHADGIVATAADFEEGSSPIQTVNGSGLAGSHHGNQFDTGWQSPSPAPNPVPGRGQSHWIRYDLGHVYQLGTSTIWNYNEDEATGSGLRSVTVDTSVDGNSWTELGTFEFAQAPGTTNYAGMTGPDFGGISARYIVLTAHSNWGDSEYWGLAEIRIDLNSTPVVASGPSLELVGSPGTFQLRARTASDASLSQLQESRDLATWYAVQNISGASQETLIPVAVDQPKKFFRLITNNNGSAIPVLAANALTVSRGQTLVLGSNHLNTNDSDNTPGELTYTISNVTAGQFELVSNPGVAVTTFTQSQINGGQVQFVHDGSTTPPGFLLSVSDGSNQIIPTAGTVIFRDGPPANAIPVLAVNALTIRQGQTIVLSRSILQATDSDHSDAQLTLSVSGIQAGHFERLANPGTPVNSFTQAEINAGAIRFVHDNTLSAPAYLVSVSDGAAATTPAAAAITFLPSGGNGSAPVLIANSLASFVGSQTVLGPAQLDAIDPDTAPTGLTYTISELVGGHFERLSQAGAAVTSFTQAEINSRAIRFVQNGSTTAPSYRVRLNDGSNLTAPSSASVSFCNGTRTSTMTESEMSSFNNLVQLSQVTHTVVASGRWSDPSVWQGGNLPTTGARIHIPSELAVVVDGQLDPEFETIRIDGMLRFAPNINTRLKVDTIVSYHCARFEVGTSEIPISPEVSAEIIIADDGPIDTNADFAQLGRGAILHGKSIVYGAPRTNKVALAVHPAAGTSTLQLKTAPSGWTVGDELIVTGTIPNNPTSDEIRTITAINGTNITLNSALSLDHLAPRPDLNVYVANVTRNVVFRSENPTVARRGHIMFMHTLEADINHARFRQLGRTDKTRRLDDVTFDFTDDLVGNLGSAPVHFTTVPGARTNIRGRYPIHLHRGGTDPTTTPALINGCVVDDAPGWGFVMHSAHARFVNNVSYAVQGTGFYTEAGDEIGEMVGNIAIRSVNPVFTFDSPGGAIDPDLGFDQQEFGNDGDGFWLSGNLVAMKNNVSAGSTAHGIIYWVDGLVEADIPRGRASVRVSEIPNGHLIPGRETIPTWWAPLAEVSGNECYNSAIGFRARYIHAQTYVGEGGSPFHASPPQAYIDALDPVIDGLAVWGNRDGVLLNYCQRVSLKNALIVGIGAPFVLDGGTANSGVGLDKGTEVSRGPGRIENVTIEGFEMGFVAPRNDQWTFTNMTLRNVSDMLVAEPRQGPRSITMSNINFGSLTGTAVAGRSGRRNIVMEANFEALGYQPFWFVMPDRITLDGEGVYFNEQAASHTPLSSAPNPEELLQPIPSSYVGRTNQQLHSTFGLSFGGAFHPANARSDGRISGGVMGSPAPAATVFPTLLDMTGEGGQPEPPKGGPTPELTGNRLNIRQGETVTVMITNLNTTDTNTGIEGLTYTVSALNHGFFAHRDTPATAITTFTQAQVNGGVIRFVHDGSNNAPSYQVRVSDGTSSTTNQAASIMFQANP